MRIILSFLAVFATLVAAVLGAEFEYDEGVLVLTDDNFDAAIEQNPMILVEFYAPWCGHCKKLAPEYASAAGQLKGENLVLAKLDATEHKEAGGKFGIKGFPTLKLFRSGTPIDYQGGRTAADLVAYMRKKSGPPAKTLSSAEEVKAFAETAEAVVVGFFKSAESAAAKAFVDAAGVDENLPYGICSNAAAAKEYAAGADAVVVLKKFDEGSASLPAKDLTLESVKEFVGINSQKLLEEFSPESSSKIFGGPVKTHLLFFAKKAEEATAGLSEMIRSVAKGKRGKILHVLVPHDEARIMSYFGLTDEDLPTVMLADMRSDVKKYAFKGTLDEKSITAFEDDFLAGKLKPHLKTETPAPEDDAEPVKVIKGTSFVTKVMESDKDVMLEFYAPWCGHCKSLAPKYDELATMFVGKDSVMIAKMDATANEIDHPNVSVRGFPTIIFFPGKDKANPIAFDGNREVADMAKFIVKHASTPVSVNIDEDEEDDESPGTDEL